MERYHKSFSNYKWNTNNGYPTKEHRDGIKKYGITKYHRKSFQLLERQTNLDI
jgi:ribonuclease HII